MRKNQYWFLGIMVLFIGLVAVCGETAQAEGKANTGMPDKIKILQFKDLKNRYEFESKLDLESLLEIFPKTLKIVSSDVLVEEIPVQWECADYEGTEYDSYTFEAKIDYEKYELGEELTKWNIPCVEVFIKMKENQNVRQVIPENSDGKNYLDIYLGAKNVLQWLESQEKTKYYIGTPYKGIGSNVPWEKPWLCMRPNGDTKGDAAGMNCTGFVAHVMQHQGGDLNKVANRLSGSYANAYNWLTTVERNDIKCYRYNNIDALLKAGKARKGDILYFEPSNGVYDGKDAYGNYVDSHIGFFWGNKGSENKFWHSSHTGKGPNHISTLKEGNQTSIIAPKSYPYYVYLIPLGNREGKLQLTKKSANQDITNGNSCYSFEGAEFGVFSNANVTSKVGTLKTDKSGKSNILNLKEGTYWVKELKAPKGYALSLEVKKVQVSYGQTATVLFSDLPQMNPIGVLLQKVDRETNQNKPQGASSLQHAEFTVKYYGGYWDGAKDPAALGEKPARTWIFRTNEEGFCYYDNLSKVSGDALYSLPTGQPALPLGTITIQETKAPEGYLINSDIFIRQITGGGSAESIYTYNQPIVPENVLQLYLVKKQEGTNLVIPEAQFEHKKPDGRIENIKTDQNGELTIKGLQYGHHTLREVSVMDGYLLNGNMVEFDVGRDNKITLTSQHDASHGKILFEVTKEGNIAIEMEDKTAPFSVSVCKENEKGKKLAGAEFAFYEEKACTTIVKRAVTNEEGVATLAGLQIGKKYYLKELNAPEGYRLPVDVFGNPIVYEVWAESIPTEDKFVFYVDGEAYDSSSEGNFTLSGTKANREIQMKIMNQTMELLPNTGSARTLLLTGMGVIFVLCSFCKAKRRNVMVRKDK